MTHECPAPGCTVQVPVTKLACRNHWFMLPLALRTALWRAYRGTGPGSSDAHRAAMRACVDWWERNV